MKDDPSSDHRISSLGPGSSTMLSCGKGHAETMLVSISISFSDTILSSGTLSEPVHVAIYFKYDHGQPCHVRRASDMWTIYP